MTVHLDRDRAAAGRPLDALVAELFLRFEQTLLHLLDHLPTAELARLSSSFWEIVAYWIGETGMGVKRKASALCGFTGSRSAPNFISIRQWIRAAFTLPLRAKVE